MNAKQKLFIERYAETYDAIRSYQYVYGATYETAQSNAYKLLKREDCQAYLKELQNSLVTQWGEAHLIILQQLMEEITIRDGKGNHSKEWLKAVDLAQKQLGLQRDKKEVDIKGDVITLTIGTNKNEGGTNNEELPRGIE